MYTITPKSLHLTSLIALTFAIVVLFQITGYAQTDQARIVGTITDANGAVVPGASVVVRNDRTGEERTATTNEAGYYVIPGLRPSTYSITANAQNLTAQATNVQLVIGQELNLPLTVQPTGVEAKVDIAAGADTLVDTSSAAMGANVNPREVEGLPTGSFDGPLSRPPRSTWLAVPGSLDGGSLGAHAGGQNHPLWP